MRFFGQSKAPAISFIHGMQFMELNDARTVLPVSLKMMLRTEWKGCRVIAVNITHDFFFI